MKTFLNSVQPDRLFAGQTSRPGHRLAVSLLLGAGLLAGSSAWAQPGTGGPTPGTPALDPTAVPLDGGASLLLAGGVGYALRRLRRRPR
ncbi:MAG TPA: hypothetical protein VF630_11970 [Hymenobacter sp.]|jgi:hypothetical protein